MYSQLKTPPQWLGCRAFVSHAGDRGSIPGRDRPKSSKLVVRAPLPNAFVTGHIVTYVTVRVIC